VSRATARLAGTAAVVAILGGARGYQVYLFEIAFTLFDGADLLVYPVYDFLAAATFLVVPLVAGYVWGRGADVSANYVALLGVTAVAAVLGFAAGFAFSAVSVLLVGGELLPFGASRWLLLTLTLGLESLALPPVALAGGGVAGFRAAPVGTGSADSARNGSVHDGRATPAGEDGDESGEEWDRLSEEE